MQIFPFFHDWAILLFSEISILWLIVRKISFRPIRSVTILVINNRFCYRSYDYKPNLTPLSPIIISYNLLYNYKPTRVWTKKKIAQSYIVWFNIKISKQKCIADSAINWYSDLDSDGVFPKLS